jgi:hypothetical protein
MTLQLLHSEFPYIWESFDFLFYQCSLERLSINVATVLDSKPASSDTVESEGGR